LKKSLFSHYQSPTRRDEDHRHFGGSVGSLCASMSTTSAGAPSLLAFEHGYDKGKAVITGARRRRATRSNLNAKNDAEPPPSIRTRPGRPHSLDAAFASLFWAIAVSGAERTVGANVLWIWRALLDRTAPLPKFYFRPGTKQTLLEEALTCQLLDPKQTERP